MSAAMYGSQKPLLDARLQGMFESSAPVGISSHYFNVPFNAMFNGIQIFAWDSNKFDCMKFESQYNIQQVEGQPDIWMRYKKFGKKWYVIPNHPIDIILFPSDLKIGGRIEIEYNNKGSAPVDFIINGYTFVDQAIVETSIAQEGEDW